MASFQDFLDRGLNLQATRADVIAGLSLQPDPAPPTGVALLSRVRDVIGLTDAASAILEPIRVAASPLALATSLINAKYEQLGGAGSALGASSFAVTVLPDGIGYFRRYRSGAIYWHPFAGAHEVHGPIFDKWTALGSEHGMCGYPTTDVTTGRDPAHAGTFQHFQGASIYAHGIFLAGLLDSGSLLTVAALATQPASAASSPTRTAVSGAATSVIERVSATARVSAPAAVSAVAVAASPLASATILPDLRPRGFACEVHGAIRDKYLALGAESSFLGYPTTDETGTPDGIGRFNHFQGGSIYWTPNTGAHEVHSLVRDLWASQGWERNAALGYPISDELIPDRRIGNVRPESRRKPILSIPADVLKFPAEAAGLVPATVVNAVPKAVVAAPSIAAAAATTRKATATTPATATAPGPAASPLGRLTTTVEVSPVLVNLAATFVVETAASTPAPVRSANRFSDFENGVLFWQRGATAARALAPWIQNSSGRSMHRTATDVVAAVDPFLRTRLGAAGGPVNTISFSGVTGYVHDGAGPENRRHRILAMLTIPTGNILLPLATIGVEFQFVAVFEPRLRTVVAQLTDWNVVVSSGPADISAILHSTFDPLLWTGVDLIALADTDAGNPVAILSAKTMANGDVSLFIEPADQKL
jgi:hypothetical protein